MLTCDIATLQPSSIHTAKKKSAQKPRRSLDGWRGVLDLGWQRRSGIPSAPLFPVLHVHVLFDGCSWFSRRLSQSSDPNRPWGQQDVLGLPMGALCVQPEGMAQLLSGTCLAWERGGSAWENCLLLPACQAWPEELALVPAVQGELCGARSWHWVRDAGALPRARPQEQHVMGTAGEPELCPGPLLGWVRGATRSLGLLLG